MHSCHCTPVTPNDIAHRLGIPVDTVNKWSHRGSLPPRRWRVGNSSAWCWEQDVVPWLRAHPRRRELLASDDS